MCYLSTNFWFFEEVMKKCNISYDGMYMLELGDQDFKVHRYRKEKVAKGFFEKRGVSHISVDWNGKKGALQIDLNRPVNFTCHPQLEQEFDVVTNIGNSEHVENQYQCWKTMHERCRKDGLIINVLPLADHCSPHGLWHYLADFFKELAIQNDYTIELESTPLLDSYSGAKDSEQIGVAFRRNSNNQFINEEALAILKDKFIVDSPPYDNKRKGKRSRHQSFLFGKDELD